MVKPNLVLVHSFPTNSFILSGLIRYLDQYFTVHPIDLPGFSKKEPPFRHITLTNFSLFVAERIVDMHLDEYFVAGISFGFAVISNAKLTKGCRGIIAIEPYIDSECLRIPVYTRLLYFLIAKIVLLFGLSNALWKESVFIRLGFFADHPKYIRNYMFTHVDGYTFFKTLSYIIYYRKKCSFHSGTPHVLIINPLDRQVNYNYIFPTFNKRVKDLLVVKTGIPHFPPDPSKKYFEKVFEENNFEEVIAYLSKTRN